MNIVTKLQHKVNAQKAEMEAMQEGLNLLRSYLQSSKFHQDTTVQVSDVLMRLAEAELSATYQRGVQESFDRFELATACGTRDAKRSKLRSAYDGLPRELRNSTRYDEAYYAGYDAEVSNV